MHSSHKRAVPWSGPVPLFSAAVTTVPLATPNLGEILPPTSPFALLLLPMHKLDYTHVGTSVNFTVNNGSIIGNHDIKTYIAALA